MVILNNQSVFATAKGESVANAFPHFFEKCISYEPSDDDKT
jgi:hypothetical protein